MSFGGGFPGTGGRTDFGGFSNRSSPERKPKPEFDLRPALKISLDAIEKSLAVLPEDRALFVAIAEKPGTPSHKVFERLLAVRLAEKNLSVKVHFCASDHIGPAGFASGDTQSAASRMLYGDLQAKGIDMSTGNSAQIRDIVENTAAKICIFVLDPRDLAAERPSTAHTVLRGLHQDFIGIMPAWKNATYTEDHMNFVHVDLPLGRSSYVMENNLWGHLKNAWSGMMERSVISELDFSSGGIVCNPRPSQWKPRKTVMTDYGSPTAFY